MALRRFWVCLIDDVSDTPNRELKRPQPHTAGTAPIFSCQNSGPKALRSREIAISCGSVVWAVEFRVGFRPLRATPGPQGFPAHSSWSHSDSWDAPANCRFQLCYLPSRDIPTQPTLGDHHGREEKKVCVHVIFLFCFVGGFCLFVWPCCVKLIALTLLAGMVALPFLFVLYAVNSQISRNLHLQTDFPS